MPAHIRFLSLEPLLGPLNLLDLKDIHWLESGPGSRSMETEWVRTIRDQCEEQKIAFFF
ncbi:DUF5131 family protein, partial [Peribacillus sp. CSMR9]|uniref:DUF5131 family protein n=1 Tax=Peribacillus sp. CSMR9 TaxID=2981350 RepID=UPI002952CAFC